MGKGQIRTESQITEIFPQRRAVALDAVKRLSFSFAKKAELPQTQETHNMAGLKRN
jgi:antitoxin component HigA of HigAB toxin-antitoxin module